MLKGGWPATGRRSGLAVSNRRWMTAELSRKPAIRAKLATDAPRLDRGMQLAKRQAAGDRSHSAEGLPRVACRGLVYVSVPGSLVASRRPAALKCAYASGCKLTCPAAGVTPRSASRQWGVQPSSDRQQWHRRTGQRPTMAAFRNLFFFSHTPVEGGQQAAASSGSVHSSTSLIGMARMAHNG